MKTKLLLLSLIIVSFFACSDDEEKPIMNEVIKVTKVNLDKSEISIRIGDICDLKASVLPENASDKNVSWVSNNPDVATVSYGRIEALKVGKTTITVNTNDGHKTATCSVDVKDLFIPVTELKFSESDVTINKGKTHKLSYNVVPANSTDQSITWSSDNESVVTVDQQGNINAVELGTANIVITSSNGITAKCVINVIKVDKFGTFTDTRDNKTYKTVKIGEQVWLAENFAYLPKVSSPYFGSKSSSYYYVYAHGVGDVEKAKGKLNYTEYGVLYNYEAAKECCPDGWHLPTDEEWMALERELGMAESDLNSEGSRGSIAPLLKKVSSWDDNTGTNESGFTGKASGELYYYEEYGENQSEFMMLGKASFYWTATIKPETKKAYFRELFDGDDGIYRRSAEKDQAYSVRLVKDKE